MTVLPSKLLHTLVKAELVVGVDNLIQQGFFRDKRHNINETEDGDSALYVACERGYTEIVELLLHAGAWPQPDPVTPQCWLDVETPLFGAILEGHTSVVDLLLEAGVDVNVPTNLYSWYTYPLQLAEIHEHSEIAKLLLEHGAKRSLFDKGKASAFINEDQTVAGAERY
jgi:ankyrin repeat protein